MAPGDAELRLTLESDPDGCEDRVMLRIWPTDLDGDADHDAIIDDVGPDDDLEDTLPGVIVLCNQDDDNGDAVVDNADGVINGPTDGDDLAPVVIRIMPDLPSAWTVTLALENPTNVAAGLGAGDVVRVYPELTDGTPSLLGPGSTSFTLPETAAAHDVDLTTLRTGDVPLWVEGLEFAAEVKLRLTVNDDAGVLVCEDVIQLKVSPLILLSNLEPAETSYVSRILGTWEIETESTAYTTQRFRNATPPGVTDTIIADPYNGGLDQWAQDEFQICYQDSPEKAMYVVLDSERDDGLQPFPLTLLGPDFGHIQVEDGVFGPTSFDYFGNLEVSPPCTTAVGDYPLGRIYYGDDDTLDLEDRMDSTLREFLARQGVQNPFTLVSSWLFVGHVDELMSIVPNPYATHGWTVLLADPVLALDILTGDAVVSGGVDQALHIPKYNDYSVVQLDALLGRTTSDGSMTIEQYNAAGGALALHLQDCRDALETELELNMSEDFYTVPVLFDSVDGTALAITPNLVNGGVFGTTLIAPDPFLCAATEEDVNANYVLDPGEDTNSNFMLDTTRDPFQVWLNANVPPGVNVEYVDDWFLYHIERGEVHCSSNEKRAIPSGPAWWDSMP